MEADEENDIVDSLGVHSIERFGEDDTSGECKESFENVTDGDTLGGGCACIASGDDVEGDRVP